MGDLGDFGLDFSVEGALEVVKKTAGPCLGRAMVEIAGNIVTYVT